MVKWSNILFVWDKVNTDCTAEKVFTKLSKLCQSQIICNFSCVVAAPTQNRYSSHYSSCFAKKQTFPPLPPLIISYFPTQSAHFYCALKVHFRTAKLLQKGKEVWITYKFSYLQEIEMAESENLLAVWNVFWQYSSRSIRGPTWESVDDWRVLQFSCLLSKLSTITFFWRRTNRLVLSLVNIPVQAENVATHRTAISRTQMITRTVTKLL